MTSSPRTLWTIAALEGFSTLAVEVIAIRLAVPIAGSSIVLTGVMLGVVLLALSAGYWRGGVLSARWDLDRTRARLALNLLIAALLYGALAFPLEAILLERLLQSGAGLSVAIGATAVLLFFLPIYLASQTVPMLAELTNLDGKAGKASGRVLFFSTLGSVAGGILTPVWLFPWIGVERCTYIVCALLVGASLVMSARSPRFWKLAGGGALALALTAISGALLLKHTEIYAFDSAYQTIQVVEDTSDEGRTERAMMMGGGRSSAIYSDTKEAALEYIREAERTLDRVHAARVLVIGAAGFTFPRDVAGRSYVEQVDAVDVDPAVKQIAEREFLRQPLPAKVRFYPLSARYAVRKLYRDGARYGFTVVDAYCGHSVPEELLTVEFFRDLRKLSEHTTVNVIMDTGLQSAFARNTLASFAEGFGAAWVRVVDGDDDPTNILVSDWADEGAVRWQGQGQAYRDDRNSADRDHVKLVWGR